MLACRLFFLLPPPSSPQLLLTNPRQFTEPRGLPSWRRRRHRCSSRARYNQGRQDLLSDAQWPETDRRSPPRPPTTPGRPGKKKDQFLSPRPLPRAAETNDATKRRARDRRPPIRSLAFRGKAGSLGGVGASSEGRRRVGLLLLSGRRRAG